MKKSKSISEIMLRHHYKIDKLYHRLEKGIEQKSENLVATFDKFKWELERHFFIEEKAIFQLHYSENEKSNKIREQLMEEHSILRRIIDRIENDLLNNREIDLYGFRKKLLKHKEFENREFYPRLDEELDDSRKKIIIERLSNPI